MNTTSPQFNLDVNGSAAVNSLNGVQMAERFAGSDAAAKINACLTAATTSSGVCDAHGLTGTLTATSHITDSRRHHAAMGTGAADDQRHSNE